MNLESDSAFRSALHAEGETFVRRRVERPFAVGSVPKKIFHGSKQNERNSPSAGRRGHMFCVRSSTRKSFASDPVHRATCIRGCARNCKSGAQYIGKAPLARLRDFPVLPRFFPTPEPRSIESKEKNHSGTLAPCQRLHVTSLHQDRRRKASREKNSDSVHARPRIRCKENNYYRQQKQTYETAHHLKSTMYLG